MRRESVPVLLFALIIAGSVAAGALAGALAGYAVAGGGGALLAPPPQAIDASALELARSSLAASASTDDEVALAAVRATRPAVVTIWNIAYVKESFFEPAQLRVVSTGSGVVFDERGYIATNAHVVQGAQQIEVVFLDGRRVEAELIGRHDDYEVAILHVDADVPAAAPLADSSLLEPGMRVMAIGSPLGTEYQNTVTTGIIAGLNRRVTESYRNWFTREEVEVDVIGAPLIQTDAAINSGNSGGPLINMRGEVVALNTLIIRRDNQNTNVEGLGFAVPSNVVRALADEWIDGVNRGSIGFEYETLDPVAAQELGLSRGTGALVSTVDRDSSAGDAGVQQGDVIARIDGVLLDLDHALADQLWRYRAGDHVLLEVDRNGRTLEFTVTLDEAPPVGTPNAG
ncbi:MAG: S1C family serine protease [Anaerolineae bacterium]